MLILMEPIEHKLWPLDEELSWSSVKLNWYKMMMLVGMYLETLLTEQIIAFVLEANIDIG